MSNAYRPFPDIAARQRGLALVIALIALVAMTLAGVALVRSVDTNYLVASNMTFRQTARESADAGIELARTWIMTQAQSSATALDGNSSSFGYYATNAALNLTGNESGTDINWLNFDGSSTGGMASPRCMDPDAAGNRVCFVIQRMCDGTGPMSKDTCDTYTPPPPPGSKGGEHTPTGKPPNEPPEPVPVYRVTARVAAPRNNIAITQVFIAN